MTHRITRSRRWGWPLGIALAAMTLVSQPAADGANWAMFVHGTGNQTNAANDYWTWDMIDSVRTGLVSTSNYRVANCHLNEYPWHTTNAPCVAATLPAGAADVVWETHSQGGNVLRWIMSNPTYHSSHMAAINSIRWVNAMAPSSLGTPLADAVITGNIFESALGWLLGYQSDGVRFQQTSWMTYYNANWLHGTAGRPALTKFYSVIGTDVESSPFDGDSYCGGYGNNLGLEITQGWLDSCSDGFINCSSQRAAGTVWLTDTNFTDGGEPLSHAQSRRKCFGLDRVLRNDL